MQDHPEHSLLLCTPGIWEMISVLLVLHTKSVIQGLGVPVTMTTHTHGLTPLSASPQSLDLAEYNLLFVLSFTTPAFDSDVAPSFGTLLATVNVALNMLGEVTAVPMVGRSQQLVISEHSFG